MEKFRNLGIIEPILKSIQEQNFKEPSEIQEKAIPLILEGKDIIAGAATGSGKTLVFAAGIIKTVERDKGIQAVVLTPTRELAEQVSKTIQKFSKNKKLNIISVYGGVPIDAQIRRLRDADVVVATPGRLLDHIERRTIRLDELKILVLDEADRMLDMGFKRDVSKIIHQCPRNRQTLLFSATISEEISQLAEEYMNKPIKISAESYVDPSKLKQVYYDVEDNKKFSLLVHFLRNEKSGLVMVFCNTQRNTEFVVNNLNELKINAVAIHGGYSQDKRSRTISNFSSNRVSILVCTDIASRGIDIKGVTHIYNYDAPRDSKDYIHRIGRTARAGNDGKVINILGSRDYDNFREILKNDSLNIEEVKVPEIQRVFIKKDFGTRDERNFRTRSYKRDSRTESSEKAREAPSGSRHRSGQRNKMRSHGKSYSSSRSSTSRSSGSRPSSYSSSYRNKRSYGRR